MNEAKTARMTFLVAAVLAAALYLPTTARVVVGGDSGEFALLFARGGVAHPHGFPLYVLWLRALEWLPAASGAHGAALATALAGALAVGFTAWACRRLGASTFAALLAALWFAATPRMWMLSTVPEVFAMNAAFAALIVGLAAGPAVESATTKVTSRRRVTILGLVAGLALASHYTALLLFPLGLCAAWQAARRAGPTGRVALAGVGALLLGLSPYAQLVLAADAPWSWGETGTFDGFFEHLLRSQYGTFQLAGRGENRPWAQLLHFVRTVSHDLGPLGVLGLVGMSLGVWRGAAATATSANGPGSRNWWLAFVAAWLLSGPVLSLLVNVPVSGAGSYLVARLALMPELLLAVAASSALTYGARLARRRAKVLVVGGAPIPFVVAYFAYAEVADQRGPWVDALARSEAAILPQNAVLIVGSDAMSHAWLYLQEAEGLRPDVTAFSPGFVRSTWYRTRVDTKLSKHPANAPGAPRLADMDDGALGPMILALLATGRPLYLTHWPEGAGIVADALPTHPEATLVRVWPPGSSVPTPDDVLARNRQLYNQVMQLPGRPTVPETWDTWMGWTWAEQALPWQHLVAEFEEQGDTAGAEEARQRLGVFRR